MDNMEVHSKDLQKKLTNMETWMKIKHDLDKELRKALMKVEEIIRIN